MGLVNRNTQFHYEVRETGYFKQSLQLGISGMVRHKTGHFRNWVFPKLGISGGPMRFDKLHETGHFMT